MGPALEGRSLHDPSHPAHEPWQQIFVLGVLPAIIALIVTLVSVALDVHCWPHGSWWADRHWAQRSGAITTVLGGYVAYIDAKRNSKIIPSGADGFDLFLNSYLPYKWISITLVAVGTLVWGYADLWL